MSREYVCEPGDRYAVLPDGARFLVRCSDRSTETCRALTRAVRAEGRRRRKRGEPTRFSLPYAKGGEVVIDLRPGKES